MPTFVVLSRLTDEGRKTLKGNPERIEEVNEEIKELGAKVKDQYAVLGQYDFVNIVEAPDTETMIKVSVEVGSRGTVKLETLRAVECEELQECL